MGQWCNLLPLCQSVSCVGSVASRVSVHGQSENCVRTYRVGLSALARGLHPAWPAVRLGGFSVLRLRLRVGVRAARPPPSSPGAPPSRLASAPLRPKVQARRLGAAGGCGLCSVRLTRRAARPSVAPRLRLWSLLACWPFTPIVVRLAWIIPCRLRRARFAPRASCSVRQKLSTIRSPPVGLHRLCQFLSSWRRAARLSS